MDSLLSRSILDPKSVNSRCQSSMEHRPHYGSRSIEQSGRTRSYSASLEQSTPVTGSLTSSTNSLIPCPSCKGLGKVPKEFQNELVALIPMKDQRLKPRRTCLFVIIAIGTCIVVASLLVFFLLPRDLELDSDEAYLGPNNVTINATGNYVTFTVFNSFNATNSNYVSITISGVSLKARGGKDMNIIVGHAAAYTDGLTLPLKSSTVLDIPITITYDGPIGSMAVRDCSSPFEWEYDKYVSFDLNVNISLLGSTSQTTFTSFQKVGCHPTPPNHFRTPSQSAGDHAYAQLHMLQPQPVDNTAYRPLHIASRQPGNNHAIKALRMIPPTSGSDLQTSPSKPSVNTDYKPSQMTPNQTHSEPSYRTLQMSPTLSDSKNY